MSPNARPPVSVVVPVVSAAVADVVFANWAEDLDVWSGSFSWDGSDKWRRRARMAFLRASVPCSTFIYLAAADTGPIKVGLSQHPIQRVASLPGYEAIVAVAAQTRGVERELHNELRDFQVNGGRDWAGHLGVKYEWYERLSPVLSLAYRLANAADSRIQQTFGVRRGSAA